MTTTRSIGAAAGVFTFSASIALLTGLPGAAAGDATVQWPQQAQSANSSVASTDELSQLKANQQLLQQQIDQLALGAPGGVPAPGAASMAGSFPRSFLIPGTDTSLLVGGYVKLDVCYWLEGGSAQGNGSNQLCGLEGPPLISSVALDSHGTGLFAPAFFNAHSRASNIFDFTARESRLRVETRTPTAWGEADTVWEMDFYGCQSGGLTCNDNDYGPSSQVPRLRLGYGTLGGFAAGQMFLPVLNLDANPETLDFSGDVGEFGVARAPVVGYKWAGPYGMSLGAYLVQPATSVYTSAGAMTSSETGGTAGSLTANTTAINTDLGVNPAKAELPNLNLVSRWQQPWGSLQIAGVVQQLNLVDGAYVSKHFLGGGGVVEADVHPGWFGWSKDHMGAQVWAGDGLDRYGANPTGTEPGTWPGIATNYGGLGAGCYGYSNSSGGVLGGGALVGANESVLCSAPGNTAANAAKVIATTIISYGGEANYQHWWTPNLRTNVTFGYQQQDIPTQLIGLNNETLAYNKRLLSSHVNLIWSPVAFVNTGFEYIYGNRLTVWNQTGNEHVIDYSFQVKF